MVIRRILAQLEKHGTQRHSICVNNVELTAHNIVKLRKHTKNVSCLNTGSLKLKLSWKPATGLEINWEEIQLLIVCVFNYFDLTLLNMVFLAVHNSSIGDLVTH